MSARMKPKASTLRLRRDDLFDVPLPIPSGTIYDDLRTSADVPDDEIGWIVKALNDRRHAERVQLQARIDRACTQVPGLLEATSRLTELRGNPDTSARKLRDAQETVSTLERRLLAVDPGINEARRREKELAEEIEKLNALKLDQPAFRRSHDEIHPPLALLKIVPATRDQFIDTPRVLLTLVRREITAFLRAEGEPVTFVSDLDRDDFTADFSHHLLLDGPQEE